MTYTFRNTEINNEKASNFETKSLLYLIGQRKDSKDVMYVTFDCFNDVSGVNKKLDKIWDIQSKNEKSLNPKKIGEYLFTLFDNHLSIFSFEEFIFFCPKLKENYKIDNSKRIYGYNNIVDGTQKRIYNGLLEKVTNSKGNTIDYSKEISNFLSKVMFVEDSISENDYIKAVTKFKNTDLKTDAFYTTLFRELRDIQTSKKNSYIENTVISEIRDVLNFKRHLSAKDIENLIISRIIGCEIFAYKSIPVHFSVHIEKYDIEDKLDILQECNANLSRAFFNKNSNKVFWEVCEKLLTYLSSAREKNIDIIYDNLFSTYNFKVSYLTKTTILYLISIIIEGLA